MEEISSSETSVLNYMEQHPRIRRHENVKSRHRPTLFERYLTKSVNCEVPFYAVFFILFGPNILISTLFYS
jgi:hypothetical protein